MKNLLEWNEEAGYGFYPAPGDVYDNGYFDAYVEYAKTPRAQKVNVFRRDLVNGYVKVRDVVDVGIGCGQFIELRDRDVRPMTYGYDINPKAIRWLLDRGIWWDPYQRTADVVTLWDTLECMRHPERLIPCVKRLVFMSLPIFEGKEHVLRSKYFKPNEPYHFFTYQGLVKWMEQYGFICIEHTTREEELGCENIETFVFRKVK